VTSASCLYAIERSENLNGCEESAQPWREEFVASHR
jgi:hypothetical protein